jgi:hypothetical protein
MKSKQIAKFKTHSARAILDSSFCVYKTDDPWAERLPSLSGIDRKTMHFRLNWYGIARYVMQNDCLLTRDNFTLSYIRNRWVSLKTCTILKTLCGVNFVKLHIFDTKHKINTYSIWSLTQALNVSRDWNPAIGKIIDVLPWCHL